MTLQRLEEEKKRKKSGDFLPVPWTRSKLQAVSEVRLIKSAPTNFVLKSKFGEGAASGLKAVTVFQIHRWLRLGFASGGHGHFLNPNATVLPQASGFA